MTLICVYPNISQLHRIQQEWKKRLLNINGKNRLKWLGCMLRFCLDNKVGGYRCRSQVPEHEILKIVRIYEPIITEFFDNEEEMVKFQKWREEYEEKEHLEKEEKAKKKAGTA